MSGFLIVFAPCLVIAVYTYWRTDVATMGGARLPMSLVWGVCLGSPISLFVWLPLVALFHGPFA